AQRSPGSAHGFAQSRAEGERHERRKPSRDSQRARPGGRLRHEHYGDLQSISLAFSAPYANQDKTLERPRRRRRLAEGLFKSRQCSAAGNRFLGRGLVGLSRSPRVTPNRNPPSSSRALAQLADLSPAYFGMVMATGIVSLAAHLLAYPG